MLKKPLSILLTLALLLSCVCVFSASADPDPYLIDNFDGYTNDVGMQAVWGQQNTCNYTLNTDAAKAASGKSMKLSYASADHWDGIYADLSGKTKPADAAGIGMWVYSPVDTKKLEVRLQYNWAVKYAYAMDLKEGANFVKIAFSDDGWVQNPTGNDKPTIDKVSLINQVMLYTGELGGYTLYVDDIRFLTEQDFSSLYLIDNFDGYADDEAAAAAWASENNYLSSLNAEAAYAESGKSLKLDKNSQSWGGLYLRNESNGLGAPADAVGYGMWVYSPVDSMSITVQLRYKDGDNMDKYSHTVALSKGANLVKMAFADGWTHDNGGNKLSVTDVEKIDTVYLSVNSGYCYVDDIRFLKESELDGGDTPPVEVPEEPTLPTDPNVLDDFEGYANSASLGYNSLWVDNSGGGCTATLTLESGADNVREGSSLKIDSTDKGWMTVTRNSVTVPADATSMTFWAKAETEMSLKLEFRLNNNDYKYAPAAPIKIGTEGALYTVYFEDVKYVPGSGGADKGWIFNEECLVNAINFQRDGYDAITLYLDDITFGKETKPVDPNNPITKLEAAIDELPAYDDLTVLDLEKIETVYADYSALTADEKKLVSNRQDLLDAKELADSWVEALGDKLDAVVELGEDIAALPATVTAADKETVEALWKTYSALTAEQKALVPGGDVLKAAHESLSDSPKTGAALPIGAGILALLSAGAFLAFRKKKA